MTGLHNQSLPSQKIIHHARETLEYLKARENFWKQQQPSHIVYPKERVRFNRMVITSISSDCVEGHAHNQRRVFFQQTRRRVPSSRTNFTSTEESGTEPQTGTNSSSSRLVEDTSSEGLTERTLDTERTEQSERTERTIAAPVATSSAVTSAVPIRIEKTERPEPAAERGIATPAVRSPALGSPVPQSPVLEPSSSAIDLIRVEAESLVEQNPSDEESEAESQLREITNRTIRCSSEEVSRSILATAVVDDEDEEEDESAGPGDNDLEEWRQVIDDMTECN